MVDEALLAAIAAVTVALGLWVVTNWNVVRVGRSIKTDIDAKRAATEAHFDAELAKLNQRVEEIAGSADAPIDMTEIVAVVQQKVEEIVPRVRESVKGMLDGLEGYKRKAIAKLGEAVAETVGEEVAGSANMETVFRSRLQRLKLDEDWSKANPVAAFGLETLRVMLLGDAGGEIAASRPGGEGLFRPGLH